MVKNIIAIIKIIFFVLWMIVQMPILIIMHYTRILMPWYAKFYFKAVCLILGIKVKVKGEKLSNAKKLLILSNHASYLDIFALGSVFKTNFVSKADVKKWPLFGWIASLGNTVYITRNRMDAKNQINVLDRAFEKRKLPLIIFPEGTSSNGCEVLPFKSSMFAMFENQIGKKSDSNIVIQPVSMAYVSKRGKKMTDSERQAFAWWLDSQTITNHLFGAVRAMPVDVEVIIHKPIDISKFKDRKELALYCHNIVESGFNKLIDKEA
ncbi:MAG: lysophospholipid acyltransferase family protein [Alphaproteobacteria bacterium]